MILCISHQKDFYTIDLVLDYLKQKGVPHFRLDSNLFPGQIDFGYELETDKMILDLGDRNFLDLSKVKATWVRKIWMADFLHEIEAEYQKGVLQEINTSRAVLLNYLEKRGPCVNGFQASQLVEQDKFLQARAAAKAGLKIPKTVYSSSPMAVAKFFYECKGELIAKLHNHLSFSMEGGGQSLYTTVITEEMLSDLEGSLPYSPMIFQERIPKAYELRIAYVNGQCFSGMIKEVASQASNDDWRNSQQMAWETYQLPEEISTAIQKMMQALNLHFGAIDLIKSTDGNYYFLEVNTAGEWGMLQKELNLQIAEAIGETLIKFGGYA